MTILYSILHMLVDGVCAIAMFGWFSSGEYGYLNILLYNFCAFAMQMPLGAGLDLLNGRGSVKERIKEGVKERADVKGKRPDAAFWYAAAGAAMTVSGSFIHPVALGLGNALFHLGGGVNVIRQEERKGKRGQNLGIFVAPGALGLYLGSLAAKEWGAGVGTGILTHIILFLGLLMLLLFFWLALQKKQEAVREGSSRQTASQAAGLVADRCGLHKKDVTALPFKKGVTVILHKKEVTALLCCLTVVIVRSYVGMAVDMAWKATTFLGLLSIFAVAFGKMAGGFLAAAFGTRKAITVSLLLAAASYLFCNMSLMGWLALFLFNMTMPITLYLLVRSFRGMPGFSFGVLTFGLFLGFLPVYFEWYLPVSGRLLGAMGSLVSLALLRLATGKEGGRGCTFI